MRNLPEPLRAVAPGWMAGGVPQVVTARCEVN